MVLRLVRREPLVQRESQAQVSRLRLLKLPELPVLPVLSARQEERDGPARGEARPLWAFRSV